MKFENESDHDLVALVRENSPRERTVHPRDADPAGSAAIRARPQRNSDIEGWMEANKAAVEAFQVTHVEAAPPKKGAPFKKRGHVRAGVSLTPLPPPCEAAKARTDAQRRALIVGAPPKRGEGKQATHPGHDPLFRKIATKRRGHAIPLGGSDDFLQSAYLGSLEAERRYDPSKGTFGSYAHWYALEAVSAQQRLSQSVVDAGAFDVSLDAPITGGDGEPSASPVESMVVGPDGRGTIRGKARAGYTGSYGAVPEPEAPPFDPGQYAALAAALAALPEREQRIIQARYLGDEPMTRATLGEELGVSAQRVAVLEERAMRGLKAALGVPESAEVFNMEDAKKSLRVASVVVLAA